MTMATIITFPRSPARPLPDRTMAPDAERSMVAAALRSWMDGDPLTAREQRIVDTVLDTNYFGQLGRLALGC